VIFTETALSGAYIIEMKKIHDQRGYFARAWCDAEFKQHGLKTGIVQSNVGFSIKSGTLRGLHFQQAPHAEVKVVRCTRGAMFDVIVDLRRQSPSYKRWIGVELTEDNGKIVYVPEGFAQGYVTLRDKTEMNYHTTNYYNESAASGVRYDDPAFGIEWPVTPAVISAQDTNWPLLDERGEVQF
jgi:dTDP-4-dehydrorhamnose 3,5-epimerase